MDTLVDCYSPDAEGGIMVAMEVQPTHIKGAAVWSLQWAHLQSVLKGKGNRAPATSEEIIRLQTAQATKGIFH